MKLREVGAGAGGGAATGGGAMAIGGGGGGAAIGTGTGIGTSSEADAHPGPWLDGYLFALDSADGRLLWARQVARPAAGESSGTSGASLLPLP